MPIIKLNKDYIARVLCENRSRPELHCNGQCYLAKKLKAQQDKQNKETNQRVQNTLGLQLFCETYPRFIFTPAVYKRLIANYFGYLDSHSTPAVGGLLRPPRT